MATINGQRQGNLCYFLWLTQGLWFDPPSIAAWKKLKACGIDEHILSWLFSYLCGRVQSVVSDGKTSTAITVISGVPQGSVLGPLLFLIHFNESASKQLNLGTNITMYADDLLLHRDKWPWRPYRICKLDKWEQTLNSKKCKYMIVSRCRGRSAPSCTPTLNGQRLDRVHQYKYLKVLLTDDLTWSTHISEITSKPRRITGFIYSLLQLYTLLVRPHLEYASQV